MNCRKPSWQTYMTFEKCGECPHYTSDERHNNCNRYCYPGLHCKLVIERGRVIMEGTQVKAIKENEIM